MERGNTYISASCWGLFPITDKDIQILKVHAKHGGTVMPEIYEE